MYPSINKTVKAIVVAAAALAFVVPAAQASRGIDDYFRDANQGSIAQMPSPGPDANLLAQATPVQMPSPGPSAELLGSQRVVDDYFRDTNAPTLSADERYLNAIASRNTSSVRPSVSVDDWFRAGNLTPTQRIIAQEQAGRGVDDYFRDARLTGNGVQVSTDDWFRDQPAAVSTSAPASGTSGVVYGLIGAGIALGIMLLAALAAVSVRQQRRLKSA